MMTVDVGRTLIFCTCYAPDLHTWRARYQRWLNAIRQSKTAYDQIIIVDDGSPILPDWPNVKLVLEGEEIPSQAECVIYHFAQRLGRHGVRNYPGWYRSFCFAGRYAADAGFSKVIHLESDAFLVSPRIQDAFNAFHEGWASVFLTRYFMPESAIQVIAGHGIRALRDFSSVPYEHRVEQDIEHLIPFDNLLSEFKGDRYGEILDHVPQDADWTVQTFPPRQEDDSYFWWMAQTDSPETGCSPKSPRIVALSMVKNEQDIIEPFVRHTRNFVDYHVILDNGSVDETRRILTELMRELDGVVVTTSSGFGYTQSEKMTALLHACQTAFFADYVIFLDADEFISARDRDELLAFLENIPAGGYGEIPWRTHVLNPSATGQELDPPRTMPWVRAKEHERYNAALRLDGKYWNDLVVAQGNHAIISSTNRPIAAARLAGLYLDHFPLRSKEQFVAKCIIGWMAYLAKDPYAGRKGDGYHWHHHFKMLAKGDEIDYLTLCDLSMNYDHPPRPYDWSTDVVISNTPNGYVRRYSSGRFANPLPLLAKSWQATLEARDPVMFVRREPEGDRHQHQVSDNAAYNATWNHENPFVDIPPFSYLVEKYQPASILDVGCGIGLNVELLRKLGVDKVLGIGDLPHSATILDEAKYRRVDLRGPINLAGKFDLVICLETVERFAEEHADALLKTAADHASGLILFSAAEPGQPALGEINRQPIEHWLRRWQMLGWAPSLEETLILRSLSTLPWLKRHILVLRKGINPATETTIRELVRISRKRFRWGHTDPGIRIELLEDRPMPDIGYTSEA